MRHILPPTPKKRVLEPKRNRGLRVRHKKSQSRRAVMSQDHYAERVKPKTPGWIKWGVVVIAILLLIQGFFQLPFLRISNVTISGLQYIATEDVQVFVDQQLHKRRWIIFKNNNYFLFARNRLSNALTEEFYVDVEDLRTSFPNSLDLQLRERIAAFVLQTPEQYIQIDSSGNWIGEVDGPTGNQGVIADEREQYGTAIETSYLEKATIIKDNWTSLVPDLELQKFHLTDDASRIEVSTSRPFRVYFSTDNELEPQLRRLGVFIQESPIEEPGEYIDLRFDESLYIR